MKFLFYCFTSMLLFSSAARCIAQNSINLPKTKDRYSAFVARLEAGETDIDFKAFRLSYLESQQLEVKTADKKFDSLHRQLFRLAADKKYQSVIAICKQMLSIDYTNMYAHKFLQQCYSIIHDTVNSAKYKAIEFGLLGSITQNGNGKTCETAWEVIQIEEEYFILNMLDADLIKQSIDNAGGLCDKMEVKQDGQTKIYYFGISKMMAQQHKKLGDVK